MELTVAVVLLQYLVHANDRTFKWIISQDKHDLFFCHTPFSSSLCNAAVESVLLQWQRDLFSSRGIMMLFWRICMKKFCRPLMISFSLLTSISRHDVLLYVSFDLLLSMTRNTLFQVLESSGNIQTLSSCVFRGIFSSTLLLQKPRCVLFLCLNDKKGAWDSSVSLDSHVFLPVYFLLDISFCYVRHFTLCSRHASSLFLLT